MPVNEKQRRFMAICAHEPGKARGKCPPHDVAQKMSHKPKGGYEAQRKRERKRKRGDSREVKWY